MTRRAVRLPTDGRPLLDVFSFGRLAPSGRFTPAQIEQIRRTVSRAPEVMVKVTGGGMKVGAVAAHLAYISRKGELSIETDEGERIAGRDAQKALLNDWHLELTAGQYRAPRDGAGPRGTQSSSTTSSFPCHPQRHRKRSSRLPGSSPTRNSPFSTDGTDTRWYCIPTSGTPTFTWSLRPKARRGGDSTSTRRCSELVAELRAAAAAKLYELGRVGQEVASQLAAVS